MSGIGIITNPFSKLNKRNPSRSKLLGYILGRKGVIETTTSLEHLAEVAHQFREQNIDILAINGGDGTISRTLTAFIHAYGERPLPKVALLRGGTMNVLACHLGIRGEPEKLLCALVQMESTEANLPLCSLRPLSIGTHFGFIYADGSSTRLLEEYYRDKRGIPAAIWLFIKITSSFLSSQGAFFHRLIQSQTINFTASPHSVSRHASLGTFASTITRLPLGLPILKGGSNQPGFFQAISIISPPKKLLWQLPAIMLSTNEGISSGKIKQFCRELRISGDTPMAYTLDGELFKTEGTEVHITLGKEIQFIRL